MTNDTVYQDILKKLELGSGYEPTAMRNDIVLLLNTYRHMADLISEMVAKPENEQIATMAAVRILEKALKREQRDRKNVEEQRDIILEELTKLRKWIRK